MRFITSPSILMISTSMERSRLPLHEYHSINLQIPFIVMLLTKNLSIVSVRNEVVWTTTAQRCKFGTQHWFSSILMIWQPLGSYSKDESISGINNNKKVIFSIRDGNKKQLEFRQSRHGNTHYSNERALFSFIGTSSLTLVWSIENVH